MQGRISPGEEGLADQNEQHDRRDRQHDGEDCGELNRVVEHERVHAGGHREVVGGTDEEGALRLVEGGEEREHSGDGDARTAQRQEDAPEDLELRGPGVVSGLYERVGTAAKPVAGIQVMNRIVPISWTMTTPTSVPIKLRRKSIGIMAM